MRGRLFRMLIYIAALTTLASLGTAVGMYLSDPVAYGGTVPGTTTMQTNLVVRQPTRSLSNVIMAEDPNGAPMFGTNAAATWSGGEPFCVYDTILVNGRQVLAPKICLGGPQKIYPSGATVPAAITVYQNGRVVANLDQHQLTWLEGWLNRRGVH